MLYSFNDMICDSWWELTNVVITEKTWTILYSNKAILTYVVISD